MSRPAVARINLDNLRHNFRLLKERAGTAEVMAVVKADAYGHGLDLVAPALFGDGCRSFGVTDACEGAKLRRLLGESDASRISLLSGVFDSEDANLCRQHRLIPAISEPAQVVLLRDAYFTGSGWIKVNTGMNRLGASDPVALLDECIQAGISIAGIMSHLACGDMPEHPMNRTQADAFASLRTQLGAELHGSLLNSGGLVTMPEHAYQVVRPGIALYGSEPIAEQPIGLKPVMSMCGRIMQIRDVPAGETISYGASFITPAPMRVGVVSLGYGDGLPRGLSNIGRASTGGQSLPIIGRVCMDYTLIDLTGTAVDEGDNVEFWGESIPVNEVADMLGTISYTLFTGVGARVRRITTECAG